MGESSITSEFSFLSYKIDTINLSILHDVGVLQFGGNYDQYEWNQTINIREPILFSKNNTYVCGVDTVLELIPPKVENIENSKLLTLVMGIAGLFSTTERMDNNLEKGLVTVNAPAILFPYLRAACSNILASAGFGSAIMPLINIYKIGKELSEKEGFSIRVQD